jgi:hypothetical protein
MTVMHTTLWSAASTFGLQTAAAMAYKAARDFQRCKAAATSQDRIDAALNCAITSWHMCEWVWVGITAHDRHSRDIAAVLGVTGRAMDEKDVVAWALRECPSLEVCRSICNGTKHVISDRTITTGMAAPDPAERGPGKQLVARAIVRGADGEERDMENVLLDAVMFWVNQVTNEGAMR